MVCTLLLLETEMKKKDIEDNNENDFFDYINFVTPNLFVRRKNHDVILS